jgi:hypothetical protein
LKENRTTRCLPFTLDDTTNYSDEGEALMHAKYMYDLCSLFMHISTYYNVISCYNHFYNVLWGFSIDPPYFGYNSAGQENPVLHIFIFRDLPGLKLTHDFWSVNILSREAPKEEEVNEMRTRGRTSTGGAGPA